MPSTMPYQMGKRHGLNGIRAFAHRNGLRYDSQRGNELYILGYAAGARERYETKRKVGLDYSNPLNNQLFTGGLDVTRSR